MSGYQAKGYLDEARLLEEKMRSAILCVGTEQGSTAIGDILKRFHQARAAREEQARRAMYLQKEKQERNQRARKRPDADPLDAYKRVDQGPSKLHNYRDFAKRVAQGTKVMTSRHRIDQEYVDSVLVPQLLHRRRERETERKRKRELAGPPRARISVLRTAFGPYSFLRVTGRPRPKGSAGHFRLLSHIVDLERKKLQERLEHLRQLALDEAQWEHAVEGAGVTASQLRAEWLAPVRVAMSSYNTKVQKLRERLARNRRVLIARKARLEPILRAHHARVTVPKWANYKSPRMFSNILPGPGVPSATLPTALEEHDNLY